MIKTILLTAIVLAWTATARGADFATCILSTMPGVENDIAAYAVFKSCKSRFPGGFESVPLGSGDKAYTSADDCTADRSRRTSSYRGAHWISMACTRLYGDIFDVYNIDPPKRQR